ncbi:hypothetical protein AOL_s00076g291 [Orbilia oligospora ATCC 24927]|uniref:Uncharacterized protein n=1 Tax=Arthrobotrys oligospora (strain ATCC 24927 / CBS 115.81 / DSM 1491) TaxID=756982 RepID=G1X9I4_ARTOA|nr:hypothetical protein AOL_s00076g291 [Orbilia oligospora ATCC 24927]EGX50216.1 hypothetical protein AOL_s00076g291 [Orbilia oligospora ATCC 24927]
MVLPALLRRGCRLAIRTRLPARLPARLPTRLPISPLSRSSLIPRLFTTTSTKWAAIRTLEELKAELQPNVPTAAEIEAINEAIKRLPEEAQELLARKFPLVHEFISPAQYNLLTLSLQPYLNFSDIIKPDPTDEKAPHNPFTIKAMLPVYGRPLPPGFHFAFFNGYTQESDLSPDGYISSQAPGGPWTRRMWAGGKLTFNRMPEKRQKGSDNGARRARPLDIGRRAYCHETVEDIQMKGEPGSPNEMMFVYLRRKIWATGYIVREPSKSPKIKEVEDFDEDKVIQPDEDVPLIEQRVLVYMRPKQEAVETPASSSSTEEGKQEAIETSATEEVNQEAVETPSPPAEELKQEDKKDETTEQPTSKPIAKEMAPTSRVSSRAEKAEFSHTITPSHQLLFRYSALTFNAHKIHFDTEYTQKVEGHKDLLVHGPLTLTFLLELLRNHTFTLEKQYRVCEFQYRHIAPVYVGEKIHLYGRYLPDAPVPAQEKDDYDPRERLVPMYDEMDDLRKELQKLGLERDPSVDPEQNKLRKKELRRMLTILKKESEKLEKFQLKPKRIIDYRKYELWAENDKGQIVVRGTVLIEDLPTKVELTPEQQWKKYQSEMARNRKMMQKQLLQTHRDEVRKRRRERKQRLRSQQMERERLRRQEREKLYKEAKAAIARGELPPDHKIDYSTVDAMMKELEARHKAERQEAEAYLERGRTTEELMDGVDDDATWKVDYHEQYEQEDLEGYEDNYNHDLEEGEESGSDDDGEEGEEGEEDEEDDEYEDEEYRDQRDERREEEYDDEDIDWRKRR